MSHLNNIFMNFNLYEVEELSFDEMIETDGGIIPFLIIGAVLLLSSCGNQSSSNKNGKQINVQCNDCTITIHNDTVKVAHK